MQNLSKGKRNEAKFQEKLTAAKNHILFCIEIYRLQMKAGRFFVHEHPKSATSWQMPEMVALAVTKGVDSAVCDMCAYGMVAEDEQGLAGREEHDAAEQFVRGAEENKQETFEENTGDSARPEPRG